jgi:hypothetical protein
MAGPYPAGSLKRIQVKIVIGGRESGADRENRKFHLHCDERQQRYWGTEQGQASHLRVREPLGWSQSWKDRFVTL